MAEFPLRITSEYVRSLIGLWGTAIGWAPNVSRRLHELGLDRLDVIEVLRTGETTVCEKETSNGATVVIEGVTCDDATLRIVLWSDAGIPLIKVMNVYKI